uniref:CDK5 regulatory subunit-associated protein 3 n=1 Tax=Phallusia mammillata TaxID=59560 RepID=A0A6F9D8Q8_9ASCI|nr:CDK5 regulatory subunit-associated protein 3 [Phallusia mammillata]
MADSEIPIDIQCNKLVDWLIDRRHCNIKWQTAAEVVKSKIADALKDMPNTKEMRQLLEGSCFHYFKCVKIVEVLKDTEKDSKNIFGRYSSQRMKDWQEIIKLYEKENLHIAELSSRLLRNLNYEIPAVKKQKTKCDQVREECKKKIQDCDRNTNEAKRHYIEECKKVGIAGTNVRRELLDLVKDLPQELNAIAEQCKGLLPVLEYYIAFVEFSLGNDSFSSTISPLIRHLIKHGNTTVYQWKTGFVPDKVIRRDSIKAEEDETDAAEEGEIDWGNVIDMPQTDNDVIDFGIEDENIEIVVENSGEGMNGNSEDNGFEIVTQDNMRNWDIEEVSVTEVPNGSKLSTTERLAEGDDALNIMEYAATRTQLTNELMELTGFLSQRLTETKGDSDLLSINQFQSAPPILQLTSVNELESMLASVTDIYNQLNTTKMSHLCRILDSPRFVDRLTETLARHQQLTKKYEAQIRSYEQRIRDVDAEQSSLHPKLELLTRETKEWQKLIEKEISERYRNRPVHLMGTINML